LCTLFCLIFIDLQNMGVISATPCICMISLMVPKKSACSFRCVCGLAVLCIQGSQWHSQYLASPKTATKCAAAPAVYRTVKRKTECHVRSELLEHGTDQCAILRALSVAWGSRDWHYIHLVLYCEIFTAHWPTPLECHMMMCTAEHWCSLNTSVLIYHTAVTSHKTMIVTFQYITHKSSLLLLHSGPFSMPAQS